MVNILSSTGGRKKNLLPMISSELLNDLVLGGHQALVKSYADSVKYPMEDGYLLHRVAKYQGLSKSWKDETLKEEFLGEVARYVLGLARANGTSVDDIDAAIAEAGELTTSSFAHRLHYPPLNNDSLDPLQILANLGLPIYLTTSPFTFIELALINGGRYPRTEMCRWHSGLDNAPSVLNNNGGWLNDEPACEHNRPDGVYQPCPHKPLVFHLFGVDEYADSLVLTEDDYLTFLMALAKFRGKDTGVDPIHDVVKGALESSTLLLVGFSLASWSFRALFWGLMKPIQGKTYERRCCLQLVPSKEEQEYLTSYLRQDAHFDQVYWEEDVAEFIRRGLKPAGEGVS